METTNTTATKLPDISEVRPISEEDEICLNEIREVLMKHNSLNRFGITLLHGHFDISDDEILVEVCDVENRKLISSPMKREEVAKAKSIETNWRFDADQQQLPRRICIESCFDGGPIGHLAYHDHLANSDM